MRGGVELALQNCQICLRTEFLERANLSEVLSVGFRNCRLCTEKALECRLGVGEPIGFTAGAGSAACKSREDILIKVSCKISLTCALCPV
jgi:hypothetical protein